MSVLSPEQATENPRVGGSSDGTAAALPRPRPILIHQKIGTPETSQDQPFSLIGLESRVVWPLFFNLSASSQGHIVIPDFWCARECHLYRVDEHIDRFVDDRESRGYDFETTAVGDDILQGRRESAVMPLAVSRTLQAQIAAIKALCQTTAK